MIFPGWSSTLSFLKYFVAWLGERKGLQKPVPLISGGSYLEQMEDRGKKP